MKTQIEKVSIKEVEFKTEALKQAVSIMLDNEYIILINPEQRTKSYVIFSKSEKIGYCQSGDFGHGVTFSTVHKGNRKCGTGFGLQSWDEAIDNPTLKDIEQAFIFTPNWAKNSNRECVIKYKGLDDYFSLSINNITKKVQLTK